MQHTKLQFYTQIIYGESNFYHPNKQMVLRKILEVQQIYQDCLSSSGFPFPLIPISVNKFYEFCDLSVNFEDEVEALDIFDDYFIYGKEQFEQYLALGLIEEHLTLKEILENHIDKLDDFDDKFFDNVIIYDEKIKGKLINLDLEDWEIAMGLTDQLATNVKNISNLFEVKIPTGLYYNQAYNLEHIGQLIDDDVVLILTGGIGRGKTTLANDIFYMKSYDDNYEFKYLVNRSSAKEQVDGVRIIETDEEIGIKYYEPYCYQAFDYEHINKEKITLFNCDEFHYSFADSTFNDETYKTYDWLLKTIPLNYTRHILMSANGRELGIKLAKELPDVPFLVIDADDDFSYVDNIYCYNNNAIVYHYIDKAIEENKKTVFGTNNLEVVYKLQEKYPNQICIRHSKHKPTKLETETDSDYAKRLNKWERWEQLQQDTQHLYHKTDKGYCFNCPILISTKANDNGINLCDENIVNVFSEFYFDYITSYQWLGRVRWQKETNQRVNFFIRTMQRDNFEEKLKENEYYQTYREKENLKVEMTRVDNNYNDMQQFYYKREFSIMYQIEAQYQEQIKSIDDTKTKNNIFNRIYRDILIHKYIFNNNPKIELKNANTGISELEWQEKIQAKQERLKQERQQRIELLESVLDQRLTSTEFKELAEQLNFRNPKNNRLIMKPNNEINELGYVILNKKSNGKRFIVVSK